MKMIVAVAQDNAIGYQNTLGWHITEDLKRFRSLTLHQTVVMGRKTWESIYAVLGHALPQRHNIVLTHDRHYHAPGATIVCDTRDILTMPSEQLFIIGGAQIYTLFLPYTTTVYLTRIEKTLAHADAYFPSLAPHNFQSSYYRRYYSDKEQCYFSFNVYQAPSLNQEQV